MSTVSIFEIVIPLKMSIVLTSCLFGCTDVERGSEEEVLYTGILINNQVCRKRFINSQSEMPTGCLHTFNVRETKKSKRRK